MNEEEKIECYICTKEFHITIDSGYWNDEPICQSCRFDIEKVRKANIKARNN